MRHRREVCAESGSLNEELFIPESTITYIYVCKFTNERRGGGTTAQSPPDPGGAEGALAERTSRGGGARSLPLWLRTPPARGGGPRGGLHARRALSPVQGQGGPGPGGDRLG